MFNAITKGEQDYILAIETVFFNSIFQMWYLFFFFLMNKQAKYIKYKKNTTKTSLKYTGSILRDQKRKGSQKRPPA